jgi:hypothetical protein
VFKSSDSGGTWSAANSGLIGSVVSALSIDPFAPMRVYAETWIGLFKSTNGSDRWSAVDFPGLPVFDPTTPATMYARDMTGVFKSTDDGGNWNAVDFPALPIFDPKTPTTMYANGTGGLFKSTDGGDTWRTLPITATLLAIDPQTPTTLYATGPYPNGYGFRLLRNTDSGNTWNEMSGPGGVENLPESCSAGNVPAIFVDPQTPATLYALRELCYVFCGFEGCHCLCGPDLGAYKSTDGGGTWSDRLLSFADYESVKALAVDPLTPTTLYAITTATGRVYRSTDGGGTWSDFNTGLPDLSILALAIDPITPSRLYAGTAGGGVFAIEQVSACAGDCNVDGHVTVDELLTMVNIALGNAVMSDCDVGDENDDGQITIDEILMAVNSALNGCPIPDVSGARQRDQAAILSSTCPAGVTARVQSSINAGEWNCTYDIAQSGQNLTITETCPDGVDTFPGTVDSAGRITVVRTEQGTEGSCTFTQASRFEANGSASSSTGTGRLQFHFSTGCAFTDCEIVVESRFSRP